MGVSVSWSVFHLFSSTVTIVSGLTLRSFIHFDFILLQGERDLPSFSIPHVDIQFSQHCLLTIFLPMCFWHLCLENQMVVDVWVYFYSVGLCVCFDAKTILFLKLGIVITSSIAPFAQDYFGYFCFHTNFRIVFSSSAKNVICILLEDCVESVDYVP
jgi:hypothetical protein